MAHIPLRTVARVLLALACVTGLLWPGTSAAACDDPATPTGVVLMKTRAMLSDSWQPVRRSAIDPLISVLDLNSSSESQSLALLSSLQLESGNHTSVFTAGVTQSAALFRGLLPVQDPDDGWPVQVEARFDHSIVFNEHVDLILSAKLGYDSVFETLEFLPTAVVKARITDAIASTWSFSESVSGPWIGHRYGEYRFSNAEASFEGASADRTKWAAGLQWFRGTPVRSTDAPPHPPFARASGFELGGRLEYAATPRVSVAFGAVARRGFALRLSETALDQTPYMAFNAGLRNDLSGLVRGLQFEVVIQNLLGTSIPEFGGGPPEGRAGAVRLTFML